MNAYTAPPITFPTTIDAIGPTWVSLCLQREGVLCEDNFVTQLESEELAEPGQTGSVHRIHLSYHAPAPQAPRTLVVKLPPEDPQLRMQLHSLGAYTREINFYRSFPDAGVRIPQVFAAELDPASGQFILLLEEIVDGECGEVWRETTLADFERAVDAMSALHARWWCDPSLRQAADWLPQHDDMDYYATRLGSAYRMCLPAVQSRFPEYMEGYLGHMAQLLARDWDRWVQYREGDPYSLVHGDFHPKQLFFPNRPHEEVIAFDWQTVCAGDPAIDLGRLLVRGLGPDSLRAHGDHLIRRYVQGLQARGIEASFEETRQRTRSRALVTLYMTVFVLANTDTDTLEVAASARGIDFRQRMLADLEASLRHLRVHEVFDQLV